MWRLYACFVETATFRMENSIATQKTVVGTRLWSWHYAWTWA
jgi:hypothetical protein